ncbi:MAG: hypothetical protein ABSG73_13190 [Candidatus Aminicenantales bacterium]|jgi:hypothetical protein
MTIMRIVGLVLAVVGVGLFFVAFRQFIKDRREWRGARERRRWVEVNKDETDRELTALMQAPGPKVLVANATGTKREPWIAPELRVRP